MTTHPTIPAVIAAMLMAGAAGGCVSQTPVMLSSDFVVRTPTQAAAACQVDLLTVRDVRQYPETLGTIIGRPIRAPDNPQQWLVNVLRALRERGIEVAQVDERRPGSRLALEAELRDAWVSAVSTTKTASAIVHIRFLPANGEPHDRAYRGRDSSINWASGDGEVNAMMDRVFNDILEQMATDIMPICQ